MYIHFKRLSPARPASWLLDNGRLNLVLLGAALLASGLQAQVPLGHDDGAMVARAIPCHLALPMGFVARVLVGIEASRFYQLPS